MKKLSQEDYNMIIHPPNQVFKGEKLWKKSVKVILICKGCKIEFEVKQSTAYYGRKFHNKDCMLKYNKI